MTKLRPHNNFSLIILDRTSILKAMITDFKKLKDTRADAYSNAICFYDLPPIIALFNSKLKSYFLGISTLKLS